MVRKRIIRWIICLAAVLMPAVMGSGREALAQAKDPDSEQGDLLGETDPDDAQKRGKIMKGPQVPPAGVAYDDWKEIK